jgi:hypothetical protein
VWRACVECPPVRRRVFLCYERGPDRGDPKKAPPNRDHVEVSGGCVLRLLLGTDEQEGGLAATAGGGCKMTDRSHEIPQDLRNLVRIVSACTLGLWAFAAGLLIGVFLFS